MNDNQLLFIRVVERDCGPDWRNTFIEWVKELESVDVWDPKRNEMLL